MNTLIALAVRYLLVVLFFPFSALDKTLNFKGAVGQAKELFANDALATGLIAVGLAVEIVMPLCILTETADRLAAFIMAGYCGMTALLFKRFWTPGDFWHRGQSKGRDLFWDFLKNFSLAGGFLLLTFGLTRATPGEFFAHPFASSHPYTQAVMSNDPGPKPRVAYWHLWTDEAGVSHQAQCELANYETKDAGGQLQWNNQQARSEATPVFTVQPVGWVGDWHENPAPQWIIVLSGRWWIESMDGTRIEQGPGEFSFGEDQGCQTDGQGRRGHRSGTIGDAPAVLMTVQLHVPPIRRACHIA